LGLSLAGEFTHLHRDKFELAKVREGTFVEEGKA